MRDAVRESRAPSKPLVTVQHICRCVCAVPYVHHSQIQACAKFYAALFTHTHSSSITQKYTWLSNFLQTNAWNCPFLVAVRII